MSVRIVFDNHRPLYTNLDIIKGRAILSITKNETVAAITVKLEGDCKTRLMGEVDPPPAFGGMGRRAGSDVAIETELHKVWPLLIITLPRTLSPLCLCYVSISASVFISRLSTSMISASCFILWITFTPVSWSLAKTYDFPTI